MMEICGEGHDDVVYTGSNCPMCKVLAELKTVEDEAPEVAEKLEELIKTIRDRMNEILNAVYSQFTNEPEVTQHIPVISQKEMNTWLDDMDRISDDVKNLLP